VSCALGIGKIFVKGNGSQILGMWWEFEGESRGFAGSLQIPRPPSSPGDSWHLDILRKLDR